MRFETSNGLQLQLRPVSTVTLDAIINELGGFDLLLELSNQTPEQVERHFRAYEPQRLQAYLAAQRRQLLYCLGWGVVNTPPPEAIAELELLELNSTYPNVQRAHWLVYAAGLQREDKARLIGAVMALTYRSA